MENPEKKSKKDPRLCSWNGRLPADGAPGELVQAVKTCPDRVYSAIYLYICYNRDQRHFQGNCPARESCKRQKLNLNTKEPEAKGLN